MSNPNIEQELTAFFSKYANDLASYNAQRLASNYGFPGMTLSNSFAGSVASSKELESTLPQAFAYYKGFGFATASYTLRQVNQISSRIVSVRLTWAYLNNKGEKLVESDYEYVLKKDNGIYRIYVAIAIDPQEGAASRGNEQQA